MAAGQHGSACVPRGSAGEAAPACAVRRPGRGVERARRIDARRPSGPRLLRLPRGCLRPVSAARPRTALAAAKRRHRTARRSGGGTGSRSPDDCELAAALVAAALVAAALVAAALLRTALVF